MLIDQAYGTFNHERFGVDTWVARGWQVEVWNVIALRRRADWQGAQLSPGAVVVGPGSVYRGFTSLASVLVAVWSSFSAPFYVDLAGDEGLLGVLKLAFRMRGVRRVLPQTGSIPPLRRPSKGPASRFWALLRLGCRPSAERIADSLSIRLIRRFAAPSVVVAAGDAGLPASAKCDVIRAHNLDYDLFLTSRQAPGAGSVPFAVFIDQDVCFHQDFVQMGVAPPATPQKYYPAITSFMTWVSRHSGVPVIVAAHPRTGARRDRESRFGSFQVESGRTAELVRDASLVICHHSTALQLAVLFRKPILFVTTDELAHSPIGPYLEVLAALLGNVVLSAERPPAHFDGAQLMAVNESCYSSYERAWIKCADSPALPYWQLVAERLERLLATEAAKGPVAAAVVDP